ncbi:N-acetyltransferase 11 [Intoshia linei]|uniref:N-alpha-acetyltransferase 40 n=1 Tax=Intoshia linei TaxID=1819745 RepID=A0A177B450_9BILA|nr:N-acetyltransferase 11 [Intoshia linei]
MDNENVCNVIQDTLNDVLIFCTNSSGGIKRNTLNQPHDIRHRYGRYMNSKCVQKCVDLIKTNLYADYMESGWGWSNDDKRKEIVEHNNHAILLEDNVQDIMGFVLFDFEKCETTRKPILYCSELHVSPYYVKLGYGSLLADIIEKIAYTTKQTKIVLTVFKSNMVAISFYIKRGYKTDVTDPFFHKKKCTYNILSKEIIK